MSFFSSPFVYPVIIILLRSRVDGPGDGWAPPIFHYHRNPLDFLLQIGPTSQTAFTPRTSQHKNQRFDLAQLRSPAFLPLCWRDVFRCKRLRAGPIELLHPDSSAENPDGSETIPGGDFFRPKRAFGSKQTLLPPYFKQGRLCPINGPM